jgi:hypothetical protein
MPPICRSVKDSVRRRMMEQTSMHVSTGQRVTKWQKCQEWALASSSSNSDTRNSKRTLIREDSIRVEWRKWPEELIKRK